jgi:hypothetical protein
MQIAISTLEKEADWRSSVCSSLAIEDKTVFVILLAWRNQLINWIISSENLPGCKSPLYRPIFAFELANIYLVEINDNF